MKRIEKNIAFKLVKLSTSMYFFFCILDTNVVVFFGCILFAKRKENNLMVCNY